MTMLKYTAGGNSGFFYSKVQSSYLLQLRGGGDWECLESRRRHRCSQRKSQVWGCGGCD